MACRQGEGRTGCRTRGAGHRDFDPETVRAGKTQQGDAAGLQGPSCSAGAVPTLPADTPIFTVPAGLVRILDRDLLLAGIPKRDERGRTVDVHAMRHTFGTLLSKGGVTPRTAQAAMRHSDVNLTMNTYTDPKLLDVAGAMEALPALPLGAGPQREADRRKCNGHRRFDRFRVCTKVCTNYRQTGDIGVNSSPDYSVRREKVLVSRGCKSHPATGRSSRKQSERQWR